MHTIEKCGKEVGRIVGKEENMRKVKRSEISSGKVQEEVEGG